MVPETALLLYSQPLTEEPPLLLPSAEGLPHQLTLMELERGRVLCLLMAACMHEALPGLPRPP